MKKKVILFLLEGITDETTLALPFEQIFSSESVRVELTDGDICYKSGVKPDNAFGEVGKIVKKFLSNNGLSPGDLHSVIHIIDTDGAFSKPYKSNKHKNKHSIVRLLHEKKRLTLESKNINYALYFFSKNLEHVFHDRDDEVSRAEKSKLADLCVKRYADNIDDFFNLLLRDEIFVDDTYKKTWAYIFSGDNSLRRKSNLGLILKGKKIPENNGD